MTNLFRSSVFVGSVAICISATMWGLDGIILTPQLYNLNIGFVVFILHFIPFLLMNVFFFREYRNLSLLNAKEISLMAAIALTGGALGTMSIVKALFLVEFRDLSIVVLLQKLQPVFAITLAYFFLRERLRQNFVLWASTAIVAGYFLTFGWGLPHLDTGSNTALAAGFSLIAAFSFGSATVLGKHILNKLSFQAATFYRYGFTSLIMFIFIAFTGNLGEIKVVTPNNWLIIFVIALTVGSGAIFLYYYGLRKVPAMISTICELCFPLSAIIFDYVFHGKILTPVQWVSAAVMLFAIVKLTTSPVKTNGMERS